MHLGSVIEAEGFALGEALGRIARAAVPALLGSQEWDALSPWRGSAAVLAMMQRARSAFPEYWEELRGISAGIELDLEDIFLWNCRQDLLPGAAGGCTAIAVNRLASRCLLFSSDVAASLRAHMGVVEIRRPDKPVLVILGYPGCLPGEGWGWNQTSGVVQAVVPYLAGSPETGMAGAMLGRAILDAADLADAVEILDSQQRCGGPHHVLASNHEFVMLSIKASASGCTLSSIPGKAYIAGDGAAHHGTASAGDCSQDRMWFDRLPRHAGRDDLLEALTDRGTGNGAGQSERMATLLSLTPGGIRIDRGYDGMLEGWYQSAPLAAAETEG